MIPRPNTNPPRFGTTLNVEKFLQTGWKLIESEDAGVRQDVITKLGEEAGNYSTYRGATFISSAK